MAVCDLVERLGWVRDCVGLRKQKLDRGGRLSRLTKLGASLDSCLLELLEEVFAGAKSGGSGKKLQLLEGRAETSVKISLRRRCWTAVSCR